tara:strand:- start:333 stop:656 length:324 start_codon:yes stop_codon:yes gene_type:complete
MNIIKNTQHQSNKIRFQRSLPNINILIMVNNDMNIFKRSNLFNSYSKVYILSNRFTLSDKASQFKLNLIDNINKLIPNSEVLRSTDIGTLLFEKGVLILSTQELGKI